MRKLAITQKPLWVGSCAVYMDNKDLRKKFTYVDKYDNEYITYRVVGDRLYLPREACPSCEGEEDKRSNGAPVSYPKPVFEPRNNEQKRIISESLALLKKDTSHIISASTGIGKTFCSLYIAAKLGGCTLVIVPKSDIMQQWKEAIIKFLGIPADKIGKIQQNTCDVDGKTIVLGMVHSLSKDKYKSYIKNMFSLIIFDEVHTMGAETFSRTCGLFNSKYRLGLSATVYRSDNRDHVFKDHIGLVMVESKALSLVPRVIAVESEYRLPRVRKQVKDKYTGVAKTVLVPMAIQAGRTMHVAKLIGKDRDRNNIIGKFVGAAYEKGRNIIVFSDLKGGHLELLYPVIRSFGVPQKDIAYYVGGMSQSALAKSKKARVILATYKMVAMATDIPKLDTCVLGTPRSDVVQVVGRILREYDTKKEPLVFDIIDKDAELFSQYFRKRLRWYVSIGSTVLRRKG